MTDDDFIIIKISDIRETRINDDDVSIRVKEYKQLNFIPSTPMPRIDFQRFWENFLLELIDHKTIKDLSTINKKELSEFIRTAIKYKLLKRTIII